MDYFADNNRFAAIRSRRFTAENRTPLENLALIFAPHKRRSKGWRTVDLARDMATPWSKVFEMLKAGQDEGLVELRGGLWWWTGCGDD